MDDQNMFSYHNRNTEKLSVLPRLAHPEEPSASHAYRIVTHYFDGRGPNYTHIYFQSVGIAACCSNRREPYR